jgi:hypothetical protein
MGFSYHLDSEHHILMTRLEGTITDAEVMHYVEEVWGMLGEAMVDGLIDMRGVECTLLTSPGLE